MRPLAILLTGAALVMALAGCGNSDSATLYILFDSSESQSQLIREGYRDGAILATTAFCRKHPGNGEIVLNVITGSPEADSQFNSIRCPSRKNETQFKAALLAFQAQIGPSIDDTIGTQASIPGSDVIGGILYGATQTFDRFKPTTRMLLVFSDMQQSGRGVRNCVKRSGASEAKACLQHYFRSRPELMRSGALSDTDVFVSGVGRTIRGTTPEAELAAYTAFWYRFFRQEGARLCWFAPGELPATTAIDGEVSLDAKYFRSHCPPLPNS